MYLRSHFRRVAFILLAIIGGAAGPLTKAQDVSAVLVGKGVLYEQISATDVVLAAPSAVYPHPYVFWAEVLGSDLHLLPQPKIVFPRESTFMAEHGAPVLRFSEDDWVFPPRNAGEDGWSMSSKAKFDRLYPAGNYVIKMRDETVTITLPKDRYPNPPLVTVEGGVWADGRCYVDVAKETVVTTNEFSGYGRSFGDIIALSAYPITDKDESVFFIIHRATSRWNPFIRRRIQAHSLSAGKTYEIGAVFIAGPMSAMSGEGIELLGYYQSSSAVALIPQAAPEITMHPTHARVGRGGNVSFVAAASGTSLHYQWYFNGKRIDGANKSKLTIEKTTASQAGDYYVVVRNKVGNAVSRTATLTMR